MSCPTCGHETETVNGQTVQPHNYGCADSLAMRSRTETAEEPSAPLDWECDFGQCGNVKKPWSGKGAKPKYCAGHDTPQKRS